MPKQSTRHDIHATDTRQSENAILPHEGNEAAVAKLAYQLWLQRGSPEGSPDEDWYRAENLLQSGRAVIASAVSLPTS
jgi:hypothetical protein